MSWREFTCFSLSSQSLCRTYQESLAIMFEMAHLTEDALREYDEVEQIYLEIGKKS